MTTTSMMNRASWAALSLTVTLVLPASVLAQDGAALVAQAQRDWRQLNTASAIRGFERATADPAVAADAHLGLGRIRAFRGWQAEGAFPGWHEEVDQRPLALAAYRRAAELRPTWAEPHVALGEALLLDGRPAEARTAFERALALASGHPAATRGLARANGATPADPDAEALARMDAALKGGQPAEVVAQARAFVAASPESPRMFDVYARWFAALQGWKDSPVGELVPIIDARLALRPDPLAYAAAANLLLTRGVLLDRARTSPPPAWRRGSASSPRTSRPTSSAARCRRRAIAPARSSPIWSAGRRSSRATWSPPSRSSTRRPGSRTATTS